MESFFSPTISNIVKSVDKSAKTQVSTSDLTNVIDLPSGAQVSPTSLVNKMLSVSNSAIQLKSLATGLLTNSKSVVGNVISSLEGKVLGGGLAAVETAIVNNSITTSVGIGPALGSVSETTKDNIQRMVTNPEIGASAQGAMNSLGSSPSTSIDSTSTTTSDSISEVTTQPQVYTYPLDLPDSSVRFTMLFQKYDRNAANATVATNEVASITLPVPPQIVESYGVKFKDFNPGIFRTLGIFEDAAGALNNIGNDISKIGQNGQGLLDTLGKVGNDIGTFNKGLAQNIVDNNLDNFSSVVRTALSMNLFGAGQLAEGLVPGMNNMINNYTGDIINPASTISMEGVPLREHNFSWTFAPRSAEESQTLQTIMELLKQYSLPTAEGKTNFFLKYPMVVFPQLLKGTYKKGDHSPQELYPFKPCFITSISFNHAGAGSPAFFYDSLNSSMIQISIKLKELTIFFNEASKTDTGSLDTSTSDSTFSSVSDTSTSDTTSSITSDTKSMIRNKSKSMTSPITTQLQNSQHLDDINSLLGKI